MNYLLPFLFFVTIGSLSLKQLESTIKPDPKMGNETPMEKTPLSVRFTGNTIETANVYGKEAYLNSESKEPSTNVDEEKIRQEIEEELNQKFNIEKAEIIKETEDKMNAAFELEKEEIKKENEQILLETVKEEKEKSIKETEDKMNAAFEQEKENIKKATKEEIEENKLNIKSLIDGKIFNIYPASNMTLMCDISWRSKSEGAPLLFWDVDTQSGNQQFKFTYVGEGYYTISPTHCQLTLNIKDASKDYGAQVVQNTNQNKPHQLFKVIEAPGNQLSGYLGPFFISDLNNDGKRYLGFETSERNNPIIAMDNTGSENEKWYFKQL